MGTEPHQGVGGRDRPHVRVVEGVREVAGLDRRLDPDDAIHKERLDNRRRLVLTWCVVRLGDRHINSIT